VHDKAFGSHLVHAADAEKNPIAEHPVAQVAVVLAQAVHTLLTTTLCLLHVNIGALHAIDPIKH